MKVLAIHFGIFVLFNFFFQFAPNIKEKNVTTVELHIAGLMQERRNSISNALELRLSCINSLRPSDAYIRQ